MTAQKSPIAAALAAAQGELRDPERNKRGQVRGRSDYRYAGLDDLLRAIRPPLSRHGLAVVHRIEPHDSGDMLVTELRHVEGEVLASSWRLTCKGNPQERGSELTYARRYTLEGLVGVAPTEEDDDGAAASAAPSRPSPAPKPDPSQSRADVASGAGDLERSRRLARIDELKQYYGGIVGEEVMRLGLKSRMAASLEQLDALIDAIETRAEREAIEAETT